MNILKCDTPVTIARHMTKRGEIVLRQRGTAIFELIVDGVFLMATDNRISERELAHRSLASLESKGALSVLIGGLGLEFTLATVLEYPKVTRIDMVEIEPVIVDWAKKYYAEIHNHALDDPRVQVIISDLVHYIKTCDAIYDAILLDVDNGPTWLVADSNASLYQSPILEQLRDMLIPGGILSIWGSESSPSFLSSLRIVFPRAEEIIVKDFVNGRELEHVIYLAR